MTTVYIHASIPSYYPHTDIKIGEIDVRVHAAGDDHRYWDVQFCGFNEKWYPAPDALHVLATIERETPYAWAEMTRAA
jgi:hypothetical protein